MSVSGYVITVPIFFHSVSSVNKISAYYQCFRAHHLKLGGPLGYSWAASREQYSDFPSFASQLKKSQKEAVDHSISWDLLGFALHSKDVASCHGGLCF